MAVLSRSAESRRSSPTSAFVPIASALPPGTDLQGGIAEGLFMTRSDLRAMRFTGIGQTEIQCFPLHLTERGAGDPVTIMTGLDPDVSTLPGGTCLRWSHIHVDNRCSFTYK